MIRRCAFAFLGVGLLSLGACVQHSYVAGPGMSAAQFGPDSARCRLFARGTRPDTSFEAYGRPRDVAIATGAALIVGGIATAVHDSATFDDCMQARGWLVADGKPAGPAAAQPGPVVGAQVPETQAPAPIATAPPIDDERAQRAARAENAAAAWLVAQRTLNEGSDREKQGLYKVLCNAGDRSACVMAQLTR